ncbi:MAG: hypothetical protein PF689_00095 [Deltaproteobacteria bacterium]|jgi:adenylate cyclase|nr:hypothetical protein [Deltaproteobacteria bacterium]
MSEKSSGLFDRIIELETKGVASGEINAKLFSEFGEECAPVVIDSTGFTRVTKKYGISKFLSLIANLRKNSTRIFAEHHVIANRYFDDNLFAEFPSVDLAVKAILELHDFYDNNQQQLFDKNDNFGVCAGLGWGRLLRSLNEGVYGNEMNLASKLGEDTADRGETLLTASAYRQLSNKDKYRADIRNILISGVNIDYYAIFKKHS